MAASRNRHHALALHLRPTLFVANPLKVIRAAQRLAEKLFKNLWQGAFEQVQQGQGELVDANVVVFKTRAGLTKWPWISFFAISLTRLIG